VKFFVAAAGLAAVSAQGSLDCSVRNGGCSHDCNSSTNECECPELWGLDDDGLNCRPGPGMVTTTCSSNTIKITIDAAVDNEGAYDWLSAFVGDDSENTDCKLSMDVDDYGYPFYELEHGLEECGMILEYVEATETLRFNSHLTINPILADDGIYKDLPLYWGFSCSYGTTYDISNDMTVDASSQVNDFAGTGEFDIDLSFFTTEYFDTEETAPTFQVGKQINFGITFNNRVAMNGLLFAPSVCEVINLADEDEKWKIWDSNYDEEVAGMCDGTPNPLNFNIVESPLASDQSGAFFGMTYTGFHFNSVNAEVGGQRLSCRVHVCHEDDDSSVCKSGCFDPVHPIVAATAALDGKCFYKIHGDYEFKVCPWSRVIQSNRWYSDQYYLGDWDNVDQIATDGDTMDFTGGDGPCPNGRYRSSRVSYTCGTVDALVSASEPSMCYYVFEMTVNCYGQSASFARSAPRQTDFMPLISNTTVV